MSSLPVLQSVMPPPNALAQIDATLRQNGFTKIDFDDADNMEVHQLREYSRLHLHLNGAHVFAERDHLWAKMNILTSGELVYVMFRIAHQDADHFSSRSTVYRHDAILAVEGRNEAGAEKSTLRTKDTSVTAGQVQNMPDFFFRPRFKGRKAAASSWNVLLRPSFEGIGRWVSTLKSGLH